jgi:hypothetical protein
LAKRQEQVLRSWLRHAEKLNTTEEQVLICKPEVGESISEEEERSSGDLINYQEGRREFSGFQVGNEIR